MAMPTQPERSHTNPARMKAVSITPTVASTTPGPITGRISWKLVSIPPVKRMIQSDTMPTNCVISIDRKEMKSSPKSIPTPRNSNSAGAPKR